MKITLCTSPHLNRGPLFDGRDRQEAPGVLPLAQTFLPMGLLSIAAAVAPQKVTTRIFDINKSINAGAVPLDRGLYARSSELILDGDPDLIGFMTDCDSFHHVIRMCSSIKARKPEAMIVLGCVHASYNAEQILARYGFVDFVIRGEGELAFPQLLEALRGERAFADAGNLTYRVGSDVKSNPALPLITDLDDLPWPDLSLVDLADADSVWIEIGRGCPFKCNFCVTAPYWNRKHRIKSPARLIAELTYFRDVHGRRDFNFTHDLFTTDRRWVLKFCAALAEANLAVTWTCSSRTDTLDVEQLEAMAGAGCRDIYFGVESGTADMQSNIDKGLRLDQAKDIISLCHERGVSTTIGFIAGLPGETEESLRGTLREATDYLLMDGTVVHLFGFGPYRGSTNFATIEPDLIPELQFVDFPLDYEAEAENRALVQSHRDVFARYSRLKAHEGEGFIRLLEVAEEYFPLLNAIPDLVRHLDAAGVDPYDLMCTWAAWLGSRPQATYARPYHAHHGSISDYLDFLTDFSDGQSFADDRFAELVRWERIKQAFRSNAPETRLESDATGGATASLIRLNPTVQVGRFRYGPLANEQEGSAAPSAFAFLRRRDGEAHIVRLNALGAIVVELTREGAADRDVLVNQMGAELTVAGAAGNARRTDLLSRTLEMMAENEVVFTT